MTGEEIGRMPNISRVSGYIEEGCTGVKAVWLVTNDIKGQFELCVFASHVSLIASIPTPTLLLYHSLYATQAPLAKSYWLKCY